MSDESRLLDSLLKMGDVKGPTPAFTHVHMIYALTLLHQLGRAGRKRLSELLSLGEGSVRTLLQKLLSLTLVKSDRGGYRLTEKGMRLLTRLGAMVSPLTELDFPMPWRSERNIAVVVSGIKGLKGTGVEQRDVAIRYGASEAMVLTYERDGLHMPKVANLSVERPEFSSKIINRLRPKPGDIIIITGSPDLATSKYSALGAALSLIRRR